MAASAAASFPTAVKATDVVWFDDLLPAGRTVAVDSGNFMGYPAAFLAMCGASLLSLLLLRRIVPRGK